MKKIANDKFDTILKERSVEKKRDKAKKEAFRQAKIEEYYDDYHKLVVKEKKQLRKKSNNSSLRHPILLG